MNSVPGITKLPSEDERRGWLEFPEDAAGSQDFRATWSSTSLERATWSSTSLERPTWGSTSLERGTRQIEPAIDFACYLRLKGWLVAERFREPASPEEGALSSFWKRLVAHTQAQPASNERADTRLKELMRSDVQRLWLITERVIAEEQPLDAIKDELELLLDRHGEAGVQALSAVILSRLPSSDVSWTLLRMLGDAQQESTATARRNVLAAALESRDAGLRYAAANGLGSIGDIQSTRALRQRLSWEKNVSVRRVIEAELRN